jgi:hypothetical protein
MKIRLDHFIGVEIPERNREVWAQKVYDDLVHSKDPIDFSYRCSGDSLVVGFRDSENQIDIYDCQIKRISDVWLDEKEQIPGGLFNF